MFFFRILMFLFLCCATSQYLVAQPPVDIGRYDAQIEIFHQNGVRDSFLFYKKAKAELAQQQDALGLWALEQLDLSDYFYENGDYAAASKQLNDSWAAKWRDPRDAAEWEPFCYIQSNRGTDFLSAGKIVQAIAALEAAAGIFERFPPWGLDAVESIYKPLGNCYTRLGDDDKALAILLKTLPMLHDNDALAGSYCNIGIAYWSKEDFAAAERSHRQGLALSGVSRLKRALLLGALAQTLLEKGDVAQAADKAGESLALLSTEKLGPQSQEYRCYSLRTAGIANMRLGRLARAKSLLIGARSDALMVFGHQSRDLGKIEIAIANLLLLQGNTPAALVAANQALSSVLPRFQAVDPMDKPDASTFYEENVIFDALAIKAKAARLTYENTGDLAWLELALNCHELAWQAETRLRKIYQYSSSKLSLQRDARIREAAAMQITRMLYEKTGQQQYLEKAFEIAERSKAALLHEAVQDNLIRQLLVASDPRFSELNALRQNFSLFEKQLLLDPGNKSATDWRSEADSLASGINILEQEINADYPQLVAQPLASFSELNASLQAGEQLLEYFVGPAYIEVFIFQQGKAPIWHAFPNDDAFQKLVKRYLAYFENQNAMLRDPQGYLLCAFELRQILIPSEARSSNKITLIPDGFLNFIPFDALVCARPETGTTLRNAAYLLRQQTLCYAWSFSILQQQKKLRSSAQNYALSFVPGFSNGERGQAPLLSNAAEQPGNSRVLLNEVADFQHFMDAIGQYRVLHLATHAYAAVGAGQLPRLELFDQALYLPSIYALPLQADLVTLSACQTGLGQLQSGEGVMSLARAFAQAGAACVVSSLWSVNDQSTGLVLASFYKSLEAGNSIGVALRAAKLAYLNDDAMGAAMQTPYNWAGLVMVGDDREVAAGGQHMMVGLIGLLFLAFFELLFWRKFRVRV